MGLEPPSKRRPRSRRLRFKRSSSTKSSTDSDEEPRPTPRLPPPRTRSRTSHTNSQPHYEFGPSINGYRFVSTDPGQKPFQDVNFHRHINGYSAELPDVPQKDDPYKSRDNKYQRYLNQWKDIDLEAQFPPVPVDGGEVSFQSVASFIPKDQLKAERVRWHPDRILSRVSESRKSILSELVTRTFQVINQVYEESLQ
ncbi:hypothetical protein OGAPHI_003784 [Ogataea philodendri]|uniref:Uncharacterized protein n=1 Tax=Ogataea philodendri TaxID=1378263 RepID=A0A9P8T4C4_9ASCO|nr:uncharacterized protein OGAPHI_003784 [Ogataea philodendri]KAH3665596.1 hypothetical protein OGAPHI_003784 [Ogataea philodendri]